MSSVRAYYLPSTDSASSESHPVSVQQLHTLGWKISFVQAKSTSEIEQVGRKLAQELEFPVTEKGCVVPYSFEPEKNAVPEMFTMMTKAVEAENGDICMSDDVFVIITSGSFYVDIEDVPAAGWIRIHLQPRMLIHIPPGAKYHRSCDERNRKVTGIAFFKNTMANQGMLAKKEIDNHPARQAYLEALGQI
ncbi:hypothetical protein BDP27DRAFT_1367850 [Rhodocollybia butyracea]|uniref:Uncharacterized protein n=1 Tax=Rhodocollybia butyracea TaxID=206335 RepID=A0A9P5U1I0_9AGAR|nr:hypothetical protein BDP27DRAFT_1367850 [Rhodocollybia butyracea]